MEILKGLRNGSLPHITKKYTKVVFAAHSYGSIVARLISTFFPTKGADAYILTASSSNLTGITRAIGAFQARSASAVDPTRWGKLEPGYVAVSKKGVRDTLYPLDGQYDPKMLEWDANSPHVFAAGEIASFKPAVPSSFTGPVMVLTGRLDQIVCGTGNITASVPDCGVWKGSNPDNTRALYPNASRFDSYIPTDSAHNINTQYSAPEAFGAAHQWLQSVGF